MYILGNVAKKNNEMTNEVYVCKRISINNNNSNIVLPVYYLLSSRCNLFLTYILWTIRQSNHPRPRASFPSDRAGGEVRV